MKVRLKYYLCTDHGILSLNNSSKMEEEEINCDHYSQIMKAQTSNDTFPNSPSLNLMPLKIKENDNNQSMSNISNDSGSISSASHLIKTKNTEEKLEEKESQENGKKISNRYNILLGLGVIGIIVSIAIITGATVGILSSKNSSSSPTFPETADIASSKKPSFLTTSPTYDKPLQGMSTIIFIDKIRV